jgi:hypothetical protein
MIRFDDLKDKEINKIVFNYYASVYKNKQTAFNEFKKLNMLLDENKCKLYRSGNTVFLLTFADNEIQFHSMGNETSPFRFIKNLKQLFDLAKSIGAKAISSYSNEEIFDKIVAKMNLGITKDIKVNPDGITYNYYRLEF